MPLVERDSQLAILDEALVESASGRGSVALVLGEAGMGKTSLVESFLDAHPEVRSLWGACDDLTTPRPLGPVYDIARQGDGGPLLAAVDSGDPVEVRAAFLAELEQSPPVVAVVEDAHWADQATAEVVQWVGKRIDRAPALLIVTARIDSLPVGHPMQRAIGLLPPRVVRRIELGPLTQQGVDELAADQAFDQARLRHLTGGNPFFVTELIAAGSDAVIPGSVRDVVLARTANLSPEARQVVDLASVIPSRAERSLLAATDDILDEVEAAGILRFDTEWVWFRHELARRAVEGELSAVRREALNRQVFDGLERVGADAARLVHHAEHAGYGAGVVKWSPLAASKAEAARAHVEAFAHLTRAVDRLESYPVEEQTDLLGRLSYESYVIGQAAVALSSSARHVMLRRQSGDQAALGRALRLESRVHWTFGDHEQTAAAAAESVALLESGPPGPDLAMAYSVLSQLAMLAYRTDEALEWGEKAMTLARELGDTDTLSHALNNIAATLATSSDESEWRPLMEESLAIALREGYDDHAARAYANLAWSNLRQGRGDISAVLEEGITFTHDSQQAVFEHYLIATRALYKMHHGDWDQAESDARSVLQADQSSGQGIFPTLTVLGRIAARRGRFDEAEAIIQRIWGMALATGELMRIQPFAGIRAEIAWLKGTPEAIVDAVVEVSEIADRVDAESWELGEIALWRHRVGLPVTFKRIAEPYRLHIAGKFAEAARAWQEIGQPYEAADAMADSSDPALLGEAVAIFDRLGAVAAQRAKRRLGELTRTRRRLTTILFTDLVSSTERAARLGDAAWRKMLDEHHQSAEVVMAAHGGTVVATTGDGVLVTFDIPSSAVDAALALRKRLGLDGLEMRAAIHTGEVEETDGELRGVAVHIASRLLAEAGDRVVVSSTTRDLGNRVGPSVRRPR